MFVERFMAWSVSVGADQRADAISQLAKSYLNQKVAAEDVPATEQVFTLYLNDPSTKVRHAMSAELAQGSTVPRALIWSILQDIAEVSAPIYQVSPMLRSVDLLHAVKQGDAIVQTAIASRKVLYGTVVRELAAVGCESAVCALLENTAIKIGPGLKHDIATRLGHKASIRSRLLETEDLAASTRQLLCERLSGALVSMLGKKGWGDEARLLHTAQDTTNRISIDIAANAHDAEMENYVAHLIKTNQLTTALLVRGICMGQSHLFETAISMLSGMSIKRVQAIVDEGRISAFRALYASTGLPKNAYSVFTAAINVWQYEDTTTSILDAIIARVENDTSVDSSLFALLGRMSAEQHRSNSKTYERQLLLAA